jgi:hypothetical protein
MRGARTLKPGAAARADEQVCQRVAVGSRRSSARFAYVSGLPHLPTFPLGHLITHAGGVHRATQGQRQLAKRAHTSLEQSDPSATGPSLDPEEGRLQLSWDRPQVVHPSLHRTQDVHSLTLAITVSNTPSRWYAYANETPGSACPHGTKLRRRRFGPSTPRRL